MVRPTPVSAADVVLGGINTASSATTIRTTEASATAKALIGHVLTAVAGPSTAGVQGQSNAQNGNGVFGYAPTGNSKGVWGRSLQGTGVYGEATATTGANYGVRGTTPSPAGFGVQGVNNSTNGTGVSGVANTGSNARGVFGRSTEGAGVYGEGWVGLRGQSGQGYGVFAVGGQNGVWAEALNVAGVGVYGTSRDTVAINYGVRGTASGSGGRGIQGDCTAMNGTGVVAAAPNGAGARGLLSLAFQGVAVEAQGGTHGILATGTTGVDGASSTGNGVYGHSTASGASGVYGEGSAGALYGVAGRAPSFGLWGEASGSTGRGVFGSARGANGIGVYGFTDGGASALAGYFEGAVTVTGTFTAPASMMLMDHPDAPAQRWYRQAQIGSFEQVTVISGNLATGPSGRVGVRVPAVFARYHKDVRYQLTLIGQRGAAWIVDELNDRGRFTIATDVPNARVSWQLTGVRTDPAAVRHPLRVEAPKPRRQRGRYLQPELFGQPRSAGLVDFGGIAKGPKAPKRPRRSGALKASGGDRIELNLRPRRR
jgi:hypothetical protein